jgi:O-antigen ligase
MIRITLLWLFITFLGLYAWKDWYKALCGLILLMAVIEHPDMPKSMLGIQGLNPWNILLAIIIMAWAVSRKREGLAWDMPRHINLLLFSYLCVLVIAFIRLLEDPQAVFAWAMITAPVEEPPSIAGLWSEHIINTIKWVIPGLLLYDGCRDRSRFNWAAASLLGVYVLLGLQVIKWMPLDSVTSGAQLSERSLKILSKEVGYHRVNLSMMLAGATWAIFAARVLVERQRWVLAVLGLSLMVFFAQSLTGGRTGYATWAVVGFVLASIRWRKYLLFLPVVALLIVMFVPAAMERMSQGFTPESRDTNVRLEGNSTLASSDGPDAYTVTAGRNIAWPLVIEKIKESPWTGYGLEGMKRTGTAAYLQQEYGELFPHPHNAYLQLLLDNGLLGFLPVMLFYFLILKYSMSLFRDSGSPVFIAAGGVSLSLIIALLVASMGSQSFYPREGAVGMWCAIGIMLRVYVERQRATIRDTAISDVRSDIDKRLWQRLAT